MCAMNLQSLLAPLTVAALLATMATAQPTTQPTDLTLTARQRLPIEGIPNQTRIVEKTLRWDTRKTALIICDVWDRHWCNGANVRLAAMLDRMNRTVEAARNRGVFIIHAPSDCMDYYKDTPQRKLAMAAPTARVNPPRDIANWCSKLKGEPADPIDSSDGGCDDQPRCKEGRAWKSEHPAIRIAENDAISDKGVEVWNLLESRRIDNVMILGVHTNMCISGRPFGLRNLSRYGKNVVLIRDLTDTMYNPRKAPYVSHRRGTELFIEHVERYISPSILSDDVLGEKGREPHVLFMIGEDEYKMAQTLPQFAKTELEPLGIRSTFAMGDPPDKNDFRGMEDAKDIDLIVVGVRRRTPSLAQMQVLKNHLEAGRAVIGIRTASHAFAAKPRDSQHASWDTFDTDVLGTHYEGHYVNLEGKGPPTIASMAPGASAHPILAGWPREPVKFTSTLYRSRNLSATVTPLLFGSISDPQAREPIAWTSTYKGGRVFYTSLGSAQDFEHAEFRRLVRNAVLWGLDLSLQIRN